MKLLLDLGNTRLKLGWLRRDGQREAQPEAWLAQNLAQQLPGWLANLAEPPTEAWGAAVGHHEARREISEILQENLGLQVRWQRPQAHLLGLHNQYRQPETLGVDRWLALLALQAHERHAAARRLGAVRLLATFGTATTLDALTPEGHFRGGLILPGVTLMQQALSQGTAQLPSTEGGWMDYPNHTHAAIYSGIAAAQLGAIERQLTLLARDFPQHPRQLLLSGGALAALAEPLQEWQQQHADIHCQIVDNPVLDGLAVLALRTDLSSTSLPYA